MSEKWEIKTLGSLCDFVRGPFGGSLKKSCFKAAGYAVYEQQHAIYDQFEDIRYFIDESKYCEMQRFELFPGDLIMSCSGTMGKVAIVPDGIPKGIINQALLKLSPGKSISAEFLKYWMSSPNFQNQLIQLSQGVAIKNVASVKVLKEIWVCLPSLPEQERIVAIVDHAFEGIDRAISNTKKNLANARELFESYLNLIFTQKGDGWVERQLKDVCFQITDGKHGDCRNEADSGYFFLSAKDVKQDRLNYEGARQITKKDFEETHRRTRLEPGDVLITNSGTIGRTAVAPEDERTYKTTFQKSVAILKPIKELINSEFCRYSLMAHLSEMVAISAGTAQKNLLLRDLRAHRFYMPETVYEQKRIAAKLDEFCQETQRLEVIYQQKLAALNELKQSILQKAFTGELTADTTHQATETAKEVIAA